LSGGARAFGTVDRLEHFTSMNCEGVIWCRPLCGGRSMRGWFGSVNRFVSAGDPRNPARNCHVNLLSFRG
jgi:hypothetical protein